jgi:hypothetical protein
MGERQGPHVEVGNALLEILQRVVKRPRMSLLDPPVSLALVQGNLAEFREYSALHIEQAARSCVYRIAVGTLRWSC